ncbi:MAG: amidohydrolase family protein [Burkholderiales bacterium]|nr:MAG: amidohydrolase family protein [Burkholderiales bacterium]
MSEASFDLALEGATVIRRASPLDLVEDATILVRGDRIAYAGPRAGAPRGATAARSIDLSGQLVVPGLVNVHTHTILTMVRGVAEDMGFAPAYTPGVPHGHDVSPDEAVALARLGALEAMLFGSTLINDSFVHAERTLPAMAEVGLRVTACSRIHDVDFSRVHLGEWRHDPGIGARTLEAAVALHERLDGQANGRIGVQLTPHAPDTCSKALLAEVERFATPRAIGVATHLSQSRIENRRIAEREGCTPTELLDTVGLLNERLIAAHGIYMSDADIARAGRARMNLAHIPKGNATGGQIAPTRKLREAGVNLALATDNMHADMVEVMRWALCMARVQADRIDDDWQPSHVLDMATLGGARAMGLAAELGALEAGRRADLVALDFRRAHLVPRTNMLGTLVHNGQGRDVTTVVVDGRVVVDDGRPTLVDAAAIIDDAERAARALWQRARAQF